MDFEKSKDRWGDWLPSRNFVDLTGVTGPMHERLRFIDNFLRAAIHNRRSTPNENYYSGLGDEKLRHQPLYPVRPVEGAEGNLLKVLLTGSHLARDDRRSIPQDESPAYEPFKKNFFNRKEPRGTKSKKIPRKYH